MNNLAFISEILLLFCVVLMMTQGELFLSLILFLIFAVRIAVQFMDLK